MAAVTYVNFLRNTIGLDTVARAAVLRDHGLDSYAVLNEFKDDDIKIMMQGIRKDPNTQVPISALVEKRVKLACYGAEIYTLINRTVTGTSLSIRRLKQFDIHKHIIKEHKDPSSDVSKVSKTNSIGKALDGLPTYLRSKIGVRGVALSYVIRQETVPPTLEPLSNDLPYAEASGSLMNELINHTPHNGGGWEEDNATVFALLQDMVQDVSMASSLKQHQRNRNGRAAYLSLIQHNLGSAQWDKIILKAEEVHNVRVWNGRNSRYTLKRHVDMHRDAYNDMVRANEHIAYETPNEHTRVSRLLRSVQANQLASIAAAKTTIEATPSKRDDFELAADFLILNAPASKSLQQEQRIAAFDTDATYEKSSKYKDGQVQDRFYTVEEYRKLSTNQKMKLKLLREQRGDDSKPSGKRSNRNDQKKNNYKKLKSENADLMQRISALESRISGNTSEDSRDEKSGPKKVQFNPRTKKG